MIFRRSIEGQARKILWEYKKMAFISGPRQVGKTTFARTLLKESGQGCYFNWDDLTDQKMLAQDPYFYEKRDREPKRVFLVIFDEIHKYRRWKSYLKGIFDREASDYSFIVTGSGGGDSLMGR